MFVRFSPLVLAAACSQAAPPAAPSPSRAAMPEWSEATFATNVRAEFASRFPGATLDTIEEDRFRVRPKAGDGLEISFAKAHAECRDHWASCAASVDYTLRAMAEMKNPAPVPRRHGQAVLERRTVAARRRSSRSGPTRPHRQRARSVR
jgi:hypothetical protein